jgi:hypothetical protein
MSTPELGLRAKQLLSPAGRSSLANVIVKRLGEAHGPNLGPYTAWGHEQNAQVRAYADNLRAIVSRLRDDRPIDAQAAGMTARLVNDRNGPLYSASDASLGDAVLSVRLALDRSCSRPRDVPRAA